MNDKDNSILQLNTFFANNIRKYTFAQTIRKVMALLYSQDDSLTDTQVYDRISFRTNPSLGSPLSEIESVRFIKQDGLVSAVVTLNIIGLSGTSSPLPPVYLEPLLASSEKRFLSSFISLLNHRIQRLLFPVWEHYRYYSRFRHGFGDGFSMAMLSLLGLYPHKEANHALNICKLMPFIGFLVMRRASIGMLEGILRHYFSHQYLSIEEFKETHVDIPERQQSLLGHSNVILGESTFIGTKIPERNSRFQINIMELTWPLFIEFLYKSERINETRLLTSYLLKEPLSYNICLRIKQGEARTMKLSNPYARLGRSSWIGEDISDGHIILEMENL